MSNEDSTPHPPPYRTLSEAYAAGLADGASSVLAGYCRYLPLCSAYVSGILKTPPIYTEKTLRDGLTSVRAALFLLHQTNATERQKILVELAAEALDNALATLHGGDEPARQLPKP